MACQTRFVLHLVQVDDVAVLVLYRLEVVDREEVREVEEEGGFGEVGAGADATTEALGAWVRHERRGSWRVGSITRKRSNSQRPASWAQARCEEARTVRGRTFLARSTLLDPSSWPYA